MILTKQPVILIPAFQPEDLLFDLVATFNQSHSVIIVNDGSNDSCSSIFDKLSTLSNVHILHHAVNLGKGRALQSGFNYFLNTFCSPGVVTADADGQHVSQDIKMISQTLLEHPNALCLGSRSFDKNVPIKSKFGNHITRLIFKFFIGKTLQDTQTGLRGIPTYFVKDLLKVQSSGYEFELEMLIKAVRLKILLIERPIQTVYINQNRASHFNPVTDSIKIYYIFLRFSALSLSTALLDFVVFTAVFSWLQAILPSLFLGRLVAGSYNFYFGRALVFKSEQNWKPQAFRFMMLVLVLMTISYGLIQGLTKTFHFNIYFSKVFIETLLFFASFAIQDIWVFKKTT